MKLKRVSRWIQIQYTRKEGLPYFNYQGKRYHTSNADTSCPVILRCRNNPWGNMPDVPDNIVGYSSESYNPIFVECNNTGEAVRVYERSE